MNTTISKKRWYTSVVLQGIIVLMFSMGAIMNLLKTKQAVQGAVDIGYSESTVFCLGIVLFFSTLLYVVPKTIFIGAILLTAWLGGAVASHVINGDPVINIIFPIVFGVLVWFAPLLRKVQWNINIP